MADKGTEKKARMMSAIMTINKRIGVDLELEEISRILVEELVAIVGCSGCAILMIEEGKVSILAERDFSKLFARRRFIADIPAIKHVVENKQGVCIGDITKSAILAGLPQECPLASLLCTPVMLDADVKGIIFVWSSDEDAFDEDDHHFIDLLAREASLKMERSSFHSQVEALATKDCLTGCYNRRVFDEDVEAEMARARRYENPLSLLMIEIDWFKKYSDSHGHFMGEMLLKKIANICRSNLRIIDKVYRYSEEEFVILLPETGKWRALSVAKRLHKLIEQERFAGEKDSQPKKKVTVSVGLASYPWDGHFKADLLKSGKAALDRAKSSGKNAVRAFDSVGLKPPTG
jgi:diguanylate cyclase (GGDEF)-like protein